MFGSVKMAEAAENGWNGLTMQSESELLQSAQKTDKTARTFVREEKKRLRAEEEKELSPYMETTKEERAFLRAIRAGIAVSAATATLCTVYLIHPFTPQDIVNSSAQFGSVIETGVLTSGHAAVKTAKVISSATEHAASEVQKQIEASRAKKAADAALKEQMMQKTLDLYNGDSAALANGKDAANPEKVEEENTNQGPVIYEKNPETGEMEVADIPDTLHYIENDYNVLLTTSIGPMLYMNQADSHWGDYKIGGMDNMSHYGCGPTTVAMIANSFSHGGVAVTPQDVAEWAWENKLYQLHGGSFHSLIPEGLAHYGMQVESVTDLSAKNVRELLDDGHILVALMGKGQFSDSGHFVVLAENAPNGGVMLADPFNFTNCEKTWDLKDILTELKTASDAGGPLWAVSQMPQQ